MIKIKKGNKNRDLTKCTLEFCQKEFKYLQKIIDKNVNHLRRLDNPNEYCRYADVRTYKDNRVEIGSPNRYINASWIHVPFYRSFISTQGPLESTIEDFWDMCFIYDIKIILMLCNLTENNRQKCANYWNSNMRKYRIIKLQNSINLEDGLILRYFQVLNKTNSISKNIIQIHLTSWEDHIAPISNYNKIIRIINIIDKYKQNSPVVVHCSAGVGRTGSFISVYNLYHEILKQIKNPNVIEIKFSIMNFVRKLKEMRLLSVENEKQYIFLYQFVNKFLSQYN